MTSAQERARALAVAQDFGPEALELNRRLVAADPADMSSRTRLARCLFEAGQLDEAEAEYREALRVDPRSRIAAGGLAAIEQQRRQAELSRTDGERPRVRGGGVRAAHAPRAPRAIPSSPTIRSADPPSGFSADPPPRVFTGFARPDFAELESCQGREIQRRFAPRVLDLVRRVNALGSSEEIASVREPGRRRLFRVGRDDVHVKAAQWFVFNLGGRWEPQFNIGMYAGSRAGNWLRIGIGFDLTEDGAGPDKDKGVRQVRDHFRRFQQILASAPRSLFLGWMIRENGFLEHNGGGPRVDLRESSQTADVILGSDPERTDWIFFGKWLSPDRGEDARILSEPVTLVRTIDRVFTGLLPLWRTIWVGA